MFRFLPLLLLAAPALAETTYPGGRPIECFCTDGAGERVELGQSVCLTIGGRSFTALCRMSLNVPIWRETAPGCVSSSLGQSVPQGPLPPLDTGAVDAHI